MGTAKLAEDYVFLTESHDHVSGKAIWLVKKYDPAFWYIQFYRIEPQDKVGIVTANGRKSCDALNMLSGVLPKRQLPNSFLSLSTNCFGYSFECNRDSRNE